MPGNGDRWRGPGVGDVYAATFKRQEKPVAVEDETVGVIELPPLHQQVHLIVGAQGALPAVF